MKENILSYIDYLKFQKNFSEHTIVAYQKDLIDFAEFLNDSPITEVQKKHIRSYISFLSQQNLESKTIRRKISAIRSFFRYLVKENICTTNPCIGLILPKLKKTVPEFIDADPLLQYLESNEINASDFESIRNLIIIDILFQTGIRRSELAQLKWQDIDLHNLQLKVLGKRKKERIIPFSLQLKTNLERYFIVLKENNLMNDFVLVNKKGKPLSGFQIYYIVKNELSKITTKINKYPHILRHSFATLMLNNGADINAVKELLGHSNLKATEIYTHSNIEQLKKIYKQAHPRSGDA